MQMTHELKPVEPIKVRALPIAKAEYHQDDFMDRKNVYLTLADGSKHKLSPHASIHPVTVTHIGYAGDMLVISDNGEESIMTQQTFQELYQPISEQPVSFADHSDVADALRELANFIDMDAEPPEMSVTVYGTLGGMMRVVSCGTGSSIEDIGMLSMAQSIMTNTLMPHGNLDESAEGEAEEYH